MRKENKKTPTLFNNSSSPCLHPGTILDSITYVNNVCTWISCLHSDQSVNNVAAYITLHMTFTYAMLFKMVPGWRHGGDELLNKVIIFVFFAHKKYSRSFVKLRLNPWCHIDYFNYVLPTFLSLDRVRILAVYGGSESSRNSSKIS